MERYEKLGKLGEGAHGIVWKARVRAVTTPLPAIPEQTPSRKRKQPSSDVTVTALRKEEDTKEHKEDGTVGDSFSRAGTLPGSVGLVPGQMVAIKKIRLADSKDGLSREAIREIKLLPELQHPNIMPVLDIFNLNANIHLVLEFMEMDLEHVVKAKHEVLTAAHIKQYMRMLLLAVEYCHKNWILHRDIKPGNLLIGSDGNMKLSDFGLAKVYGSPDRELSPQACTLWYRAPELLFGARAYGTGADMWSVGCIFGELWARMPMFQGTGELDQLGKIFAILGTPREEDWPNMTALPLFTPFEPTAARPLGQVLPAATEDALDLLRGLLTFNPLTRLTATQALAHRYFTNAPAPTPPHLLPKVKASAAEPAGSLA